MSVQWRPARQLVSTPMFLNPSQAVYWLIPRGIPFPLWMYAFIAWILSYRWTIKWHQRTGGDCRTLIVTVTFDAPERSPMPVSQQHSPTLRGCVYGQAVGDALGVPCEFRARCTFECTGMAGHGSHNQPAGTWSDDTSMALATCDSIRATGRAGERDNGNGSLMRILSLAFTGATDDEVRAVSAITHAHATSCEACVRMARVARGLIAGEGPRDVAGEFVGVPESEIRSGGFVLDTERAALWRLANTSSYAECVLAAVNLGDDTDTTAAVAGGLAGIVYGMEGIPSEWLDALLGKATVDACLF